MEGFSPPMILITVLVFKKIQRKASTGL